MDKTFGDFGRVEGHCRHSYKLDILWTGDSSMKVDAIVCQCCCFLLGSCVENCVEADHIFAESGAWKMNRRVDGSESKNSTVHMCRFLKGVRVMND